MLWRILEKWSPKNVPREKCSSEKSSPGPFSREPFFPCGFDYINFVFNCNFWGCSLVTLLKKGYFCEFFVSMLWRISEKWSSEKMVRGKLVPGTIFPGNYFSGDHFSRNHFSAYLLWKIWIWKLLSLINKVKKCKNIFFYSIFSIFIYENRSWMQHHSVRSPCGGILHMKFQEKTSKTVIIKERNKLYFLSHYEHEKFNFL